VLAGGEASAEIRSPKQVEYRFHGESELDRQRRVTERVTQHDQQFAQARARVLFGPDKGYLLGPGLGW
jgi:hypothetical protein